MSSVREIATSHKLLTLQTIQRCTANIIATSMRTSDREGSRWTEAVLALASRVGISRTQGFSSGLMKGARFPAEHRHLSSNGTANRDSLRIDKQRLAGEVYSSTRSHSLSGSSAQGAPGQIVDQEIYFLAVSSFPNLINDGPGRLTHRAHRSPIEQGTQECELICRPQKKSQANEVESNLQITYDSGLM